MISIVEKWKREGQYFVAKAALNGETYPIRLDASGKVTPAPGVVPAKFVDALEDWAWNEQPLIDGMARSLGRS
jgi:hypothetical protein